MSTYRFITCLCMCHIVLDDCVITFIIFVVNYEPVDLECD
jgi:hypothetical protein